MDLENLSWSQEEDRWRWGLEETGDFSVKSSYGKLEAIVMREELWSAEEKGVFAN